MLSLAVSSLLYQRLSSMPEGDLSRVRANLALAVGLQGRLAEAEKIVRADLPAEEAAANVTYLKRMLSRKEKANARAQVEKMAIVAAGQGE